jgi:hypothetical protein
MHRTNGHQLCKLVPLIIVVKLSTPEAHPIL